LDAAASATAMATARNGAEASVSILKKAIDAASDATAQLVETMPAPTPLRPVGGVGTRVDIKL
jgi:hypothetical protein